MSTIDALNRFRRERVHTEADYRVINEGRLLQRRLRAALRRSTLGASRTANLSARLQRQRSAGFAPDLRWWLSDYREAITTACRWSAR